MFAFILYPIYKFENISQETKGIKYNIKFIYFICYCGLFVSIIPFLELLPSLINIFSASATQNNEFISDLHDTDIKKEQLSLIGNYLMKGVWTLYDLSFILVFPILKEKKLNYVAVLGLVMILFTKNMQTISTVSRTGLLSFLFHTITTILIFWPYLLKSERKKTLKMAGIFGAIIFFFFGIITLSRSVTYNEKQSNYTTATFVIRYAGEGFCNYGNYAFNTKKTLNGISTLYLPRKILGYETPITTRDYLYNKAEKHLGIPQNVFYTFIGSFVLDLGPLLGAVMLIFLGLIAFYIFKRQWELVPLSYIFLLSIYNKIIEFGPISYIYSNKESEYFLLYLFIFIILRIKKM